MSGTKRIPIKHATRMQIPLEAVELYHKMRRIRCTCPPPEPGRNAPSLRQQCAGCARWWDLHSALDEALGPRKPWLWPHLPEPTRYRDHDGVLQRRQPLDHQIELAARLREAAREMRAKGSTNDAAERGAATNNFGPGPSAPSRDA